MNTKVIRAEIVTRHEDLEAGLMGRRHLPRNAGMLFDFGSDMPLSFWMKGTRIPLQIAYIDSRGRIGQIASMVPLSHRPIHSNGSYRFALEVNDGWFDDNNVRVGAVVNMPPVGLEQPSGDQQGQQPSAEVTVEQSFKDILRAADSMGVPLVVEYESKGGVNVPPKQISPPFEFGDTADGDVGGLVTVWDDQRGRYSSLIVGNILGVKDSAGNPVTSVEQIRRVPTSPEQATEDDASAKGKLSGGGEIQSDGGVQ